jgi:hypothetical protein
VPDWPERLAEAVQGLTVAFERPLPPHAQRLLDTLGVNTIIDPDQAPPPCAHGRAEYETRKRIEREGRAK